MLIRSSIKRKLRWCRKNDIHFLSRCLLNDSAVEDVSCKVDSVADILTRNSVISIADSYCQFGMDVDTERLVATIVLPVGLAVY